MAHINRHHTRRGTSSSIDTGVDRGLRCSRGSRLGGSSGHVDTLGILGAAGVVYSACVLANGVTVATEDALVVGFSACVVRDCLGVFSGVGSYAIIAQAVVVECGLGDLVLD
jgi:hypothetical protein